MSDSDIRKATEVREKYESKWLQTPGVTGVDVRQQDHDDPRSFVHICIYVDDATRAVGLPDNVEGVPVKIVERRFKAQ